MSMHNDEPYADVIRLKEGTIKLVLEASGLHIISHLGVQTLPPNQVIMVRIYNIKPKVLLMRSGGNFTDAVDGLLTIDRSKKDESAVSFSINSEEAWHPQPLHETLLKGWLL